MLNNDILRQAYDDLISDAKKDDAMPTFEWFCELVSDDTHIMYKYFVEPIYKRELRLKKLKNIIE